MPTNHLCPSETANVCSIHVNIPCTLHIHIHNVVVHCTQTHHWLLRPAPIRVLAVVSLIHVEHFGTVILSCACTDTQRFDKFIQFHCTTYIYQSFIRLCII